MVFYKHIIAKDFKGNDKNIVLCATYETTYIKKHKMLTICAAICHNDDNFDLEKGKEIAYNKTLNPSSRDVQLMTNRSGILTEKVIQTILNQHAEYIKNDLGSIIDGYSKAENNYKNKLKLKSEYDSLSDEDRFLANKLTNLSDSQIKHLRKLALNEI